LRQAQEFHAAQAEEAERSKQPFAAVFHLDRLLTLLPERRTELLRRRKDVLYSLGVLLDELLTRTELLRRRKDVLTAALKANPHDSWAARALARQAVAAPDSLPDQQLLLTALAALRGQQDAPHDRHYGALLLRTGSAREATLVLRAALRNRGENAPPVEE